MGVSRQMARTLDRRLRRGPARHSAGAATPRKFDPDDPAAEDQGAVARQLHQSGRRSIGGRKDRHESRRPAGFRRRRKGRRNVCGSFRVDHHEARRRSEIGTTMNDFIAIMAAPFAASLVLTGIHAYLGLHVVQRGVIFVDIALAQIAALGATVAFLFELEHYGFYAYWVSLGFTLLGAAILAFTRLQRAKIPQE